MKMGLTLKIQPSSHNVQRTIYIISKCLLKDGKDLFRLPFSLPRTVRDLKLVLFKNYCRKYLLDFSKYADSILDAVTALYGIDVLRRCVPDIKRFVTFHILYPTFRQPMYGEASNALLAKGKHSKFSLIYYVRSEKKFESA